MSEAVALGSCPHCGQHHAENVLVCPSTRQVLPLAGRTIDGKFRLKRQLGEGGMSTVWEAENVLVRKTLAIKMLLPEILSNPNSLSRFRNEATSAGRIGSPHICDILDFGQCEAGPFIVMEMLKGGDLSHWLERNGRLEPGMAVMLIRQALRGLIAAHKAGIVHRDLKPENLFLHEPEPGKLIVKLMDFGISKFNEGGVGSRTATGVLMGTPAYMSPEQIQGAALADDRTDIWAMGVILYAAIAGREPFSGDTLASILIAVTTREPPPLNEVASGVSPGLNAVIMRCLAKNPDHRLSSAQELYDALEPFETTGRQGATVNYSASNLPAPAAHAPTPSPVAMPSVEQLPAVAAAGHAPVSAGRQGTWALGENNPAIATDSWDLGRNQSPVGATMGDGPPIRRSKMGLWIAVGLGALAFGGVAVFLALRGPDEALANNANQGNDTTTGVDHVLVTGGLDQTSAPAVGGTTSAAADTSTQPVTTSETPVTTQTKEETKAEDLPTAEPNGKDPVKPDRVKPKVDLKLVRDLGGGVYVPAKSEQMGTQSEAKSDCSRLKNAKYGGLRDWQLPSVSQLVSMMGRGQLAGASYWSNSSDGTADGGKFVRKLPGGSPSEGVKKVSDRNRYVCIAKK